MHTSQIVVTFLWRQTVSIEFDHCRNIYDIFFRNFITFKEGEKLKTYLPNGFYEY